MPLIFSLFFGKVWTLLKQIPLQYVLIFVGVVGAFFYGHHIGAEKSKEVIAKYEQTMKAKNTAVVTLQAKTDPQIITKYVDRVHTVTVIAHDNQQQAITTVPSQNFLSNGWVYNHNQSALGLSADATKSGDTTSSGIKDNVGLSTVDDNYGTCHSTEEQLKALQAWIIQTKANIAAANKVKK